MSVKISVINDGVEEVEMFTPPTLKEMCLFNCFSNKDILTKKVEHEAGPRSSNTSNLISSWERYRLKETISGVLLADLLDFGDKFMFMLTPKYVPVLAAIRMSQPENLVKVHVTNTRTLMDNELEWLMSGGNVKSLDIHGCRSLREYSLETINKFGGKLEYLRIGSSCQVLPEPHAWAHPNSPILRTPNLKTFIVGGIKHECWALVATLGQYWKCLLYDFITNLEDLRINDSDLLNLEFLLPAKDALSALTLHSCVLEQHCRVQYYDVSEFHPVWSPIFQLENLKWCFIYSNSLRFLDFKYPRNWSDTNPVERAMAVLPKLTVLNIHDHHLRSPGVDRSDAVSSRRRLEFLGTMSDEEGRRIAKRFAIKVAGFGSPEGEFRSFEFYANRFYHSHSMDGALISLVSKWMRSQFTLPVVTVISLLLKTLVNKGFNDCRLNLELKLLNDLLTHEVATKLGSYRVDQIVNCLVAKLIDVGNDDHIADFGIFDYVTQLMTKMETDLYSDHYAAVLAPLLEVEIKMMELFDRFSFMRSRLLGFMDNVAELFRTTVDRFPETFATPPAIQSTCSIIGNLCYFIVVDVRVLENFCVMLSSLETLCLTCVPFKIMFQAATGNAVILELLAAVDEDLPDVHSVTLPLLGIFKVLIQDLTFLELYHVKITSKLEKLLLSNNSKWEKEETLVIKQEIFVTMERIAALLHSLDSDERIAYVLGDTVKATVLTLSQK